MKIEVFVSYATKDKPLWQELKYHLVPLQRQNLITLFDANDNADRAGIEWRESLNSRLNSAQLILLLISPYYLASDFIRYVDNDGPGCWDQEEPDPSHITELQAKLETGELPEFTNVRLL